MTRVDYQRQLSTDQNTIETIYKREPFYLFLRQTRLSDNTAHSARQTHLPFLSDKK